MSIVRPWRKFTLTTVAAKNSRNAIPVPHLFVNNQLFYYLTFKLPKLSPFDLGGRSRIFVPLERSMRIPRRGDVGPI